LPDSNQRVLEAEPNHRLAYTWPTPTPEWAAAAGIDEETRATLDTETGSK
jgi:uncharacterized protein YndB with AHSA1/START domain